MERYLEYLWLVLFQLSLANGERELAGLDTEAYEEEEEEAVEVRRRSELSR